MLGEYGTLAARNRHTRKSRAHVQHAKCIYCMETGIQGECSPECHPSRECQTLTRFLLLAFLPRLTEQQHRDDDMT